MPPTVRPLTAEDVPDADRVAWAGLQSQIPREFVPDEARRAERGRMRIGHLLTTDPDGAWVAVDPDGAVVGVALSLVREGVWGLSLLSVEPRWHGQGVGGALLRAALRTAEGCRGGIILSSTHPAAMRSYARSGFDLRPSVAIAGIVDRSALPGGLRSRPGDPSREHDRATIDRASRHVRGATHAGDIPQMLRMGGHLIVFEDRGFAVVRDGSVTLLAACDEDAAGDLLWTSWAEGTPGASIHVDFITAGQDWAVRAALAAGLTLTVEGPVFTRGDLGPMRPYVPSGAYL